MTFRLPLLLYVMAVLAAFLATFGPRGLFGFVIWVYLALSITYSRRPGRGSCLAEAISLLVIICFLITLLLPAVQSAREASRRSICSNNLKNIALALHNYESLHGSFPPAYFADKNGKPMHSWRVLILPQLEQQGLYDMYDMDEPWNGPNNCKLALMMPAEYRCPSFESKEAPNTNYIAVVGPKSMFPDNRGRRIQEVLDGIVNSIMIVETNDSYHWMEPRDLAFEEACETTKRPFLSSRHAIPRDSFFFQYEGGESCGANVAFADGSVSYLPGPLQPEYIAALLTVDGAEKVDPFDDYQPAEHLVKDYDGSANPPICRRLNWRNIVSLTILILLILMPIVWRPWKTHPEPSTENPTTKSEEGAA